VYIDVCVFIAGVCGDSAEHGQNGGELRAIFRRSVEGDMKDWTFVHDAVDKLCVVAGCLNISFETCKIMYSIPCMT